MDVEELLERLHRCRNNLFRQSVREIKEHGSSPLMGLKDLYETVITVVETEIEDARNEHNS